jgi:hypothetical protein
MSWRFFGMLLALLSLICVLSLSDVVAVVAGVTLFPVFIALSFGIHWTGQAAKGLGYHLSQTQSLAVLLSPLLCLSVALVCVAAYQVVNRRYADARALIVIAFSASGIVVVCVNVLKALADAQWS